MLSWSKLFDGVDWTGGVFFRNDHSSCHPIVPGSEHILTALDYSCHSCLSSILPSADIVGCQGSNLQAASLGQDGSSHQPTPSLEARSLPFLQFYMQLAYSFSCLLFYRLGQLTFRLVGFALHYHFQHCFRGQCRTALSDAGRCP